MKSAFDKIAAGLEDAIAFAEGRENKGTLIKRVDIKSVRKRLGQTQDTEGNQHGRTGNRA